MIKAIKVHKVLMVQLEYRDLEVILVLVVMWVMMVIKAKKANKVAIIWEPDDPDEESLAITYQELHDNVCRLANAMRELGVAKGDVVTIYMPMVPEALVAMLACARLGAVHSVVFGGFAPKELAVRIDDAAPVAIVTSSCGIEKGTVLPYLPMLDAALDAGLDAPYSCLGGVCCTCRAKLVEGKASMNVNYALEPGEVERGYVLACQAHVEGERAVVLDFDQQ